MSDITEEIKKGRKIITVNVSIPTAKLLDDAQLTILFQEYQSDLDKVLSATPKDQRCTIRIHYHFTASTEAELEQWQSVDVKKLAKRLDNLWKTTPGAIQSLKELETTLAANRLKRKSKNE